MQHQLHLNQTLAQVYVLREALWSVLERLGCPPKFIKIIKLFHLGMNGQVLANGDMTEEFEITNGVKQGS